MLEALTYVRLLQHAIQLGVELNDRLQRELDELVRPLGLLQIATCRDEAFELLRRDRQDRRHVAHAPHLFLEVPNELAAGALLRVALAVLREDGDTGAE